MFHILGKVLSSIRFISSIQTMYARVTGVRLYGGPDLKLFILDGWDRSSFVCCLVHRGPTDDLLLLQISTDPLSLRLCLFKVLKVLAP